MTLAEYTYQSAQRQKKASVTEFFAMSTENSFEAQLMEDDVFPSFRRSGSCPPHGWPWNWLLESWLRRLHCSDSNMGRVTRRAFSFFGRVMFVQIIVLFYVMVGRLGALVSDAGAGGGVDAGNFPGVQPYVI